MVGGRSPLPEAAAAGAAVDASEYKLSPALVLVLTMDAVSLAEPPSCSVGNAATAVVGTTGTSCMLGAHLTRASCFFGAMLPRTARTRGVAPPLEPRAGGKP